MFSLLDKWLLVLRASRDRRLSEVDLGVLITLLDMLGQNATAWPSFDTLARLSGWSRRATVNAVSRLIEFGYLSSSSRRGRGRGNVYIPNFLHACALLGAADEAEVVHAGALSSARRCTPVVHAGALNTSTLSRSSKHTRRGRPGGGRAKASGRKSDIDVAFDLFFCGYPSRHPHSNPKAPARKAFEALDKAGASLPGIAEAARAYARQVENAGTDRRFIPQAVTWLKQRRFEDIEPVNDDERAETGAPPKKNTSLSDTEWRAVLDTFHARGASPRDWDRAFGLPPNHPASRVPLALRTEYGHA
jgi:hypothetical protein